MSFIAVTHRYPYVATGHYWPASALYTTVGGISVGREIVASPQIFDIDELSQPIDPDRPCGPDLRADISPNSIYHRIKDARNEARQAERLAEAGEEGGELSGWRRVEELGVELLRWHAKDLQIVAWLVEASVRLHGFAGLRDGLSLAQRLIEAFWADLYPIEEDDGVLDKITPLIGLNGDVVEGTLIVPLRLTALTSDNGGNTAFSLYHYEKAMSLAALTDPDDREQHKAEGVRTFDELAAAGAASGKHFYRDLFDDIQAAQREFRNLTDQIAEHCGEGVMPSSTIQGLLEDCLNAAKHIAGPLVSSLQQPEGGGEHQDLTQKMLFEGASSDGEKQTTKFGDGAVRTREDAFRDLLQIAEYFRQSEPHSPVSYALEQAVRWGRMDLRALMEELIRDDDSRGRVFSLTGIRNNCE